MNIKKIICSTLVMGTCLVSAVAFAEPTSYQYFEKGVLSQARDKVVEAIAYYDKSVELNPTYAPSFYNRGVCLKAVGEKEKAFADFNKAIELNEKYVSAYNKRGEYYLENGDKEKALADFNKALTYAPQNKEALALKAKCGK
ncbi:MAG: tetratricopeptide repeat protein [Phascolarctobacterium sp.]|nr:tetratricopeptide repeat protein [Phascolarctobacterium sp.]